MGGHFYEYAVHVLEAAREAGYDPVLVANRAVKDSGSDGFPILPTYRHEFWDAFRPIRFLNLDAPAVRGMWSRYKLWAVRCSYSSMGGNADDPRWMGGDFKKWATRVPHAPLRFVRKVEAVSTGSSRLGTKLQALGTRLASLRYVRRFAADTARALAKIGVTKGDIVFAPTCSEHELAGVVRLLSGRKDLQDLEWRLLFRRPLAYGHHTLMGEGGKALRKSGLGMALLEAQKQSLLPCMRFMTDTDDLTWQHNFLGLARFDTVPIPHTSPRRKTAGERRANGPLRVVYMGDARTEKGYGQLPDMIASAAERGAGRTTFEFALQSNFNIPGGEPEAVVAKARLERMQAVLEPTGCKIELVDRPLKSDEYWSLLCSADVNLVLYDELLYGERSSGIFTESLTCGIPVVVQSGTWMAWQLQPRIMEHERKMVSEMVALRTLHLTEEVAKPARDPSKTEGRVKNEGKVMGEGQVFGSDVCVYRERAWCWIDLPVVPGTDFVELTFDMWKNEENQRVDASVTPMLAGRKFGVSRSRRFQVRQGQSSAILVVPIPREGVRGGATSMRVNFRNVSRGPTLTLSNVRVRCLSDERRDGHRPFGDAGLICGSIEEVPDMLLNIAEHREHYRETCRAFAQSWGRQHNAPGLVEQVVRRNAKTIAADDTRSVDARNADTGVMS